ncbi:MAG: hypothetical protein AAF604_11760 [Acidobacteriota bacterium]
MIARYAARWLPLVLRLAGGTMLLAFGAALMPTDWMASTHQRLGLGDFPASPLVEYLTRSISLIYGIHGGILILGASDIQRLRPMLRYLGISNIGLGLALAAVDLYAGLPWWWTTVEATSVLGFGVLLLVMLSAIPDRWQQEAER